MSKHFDKIKNHPRWKAARAACFERDGYQCVDCGTDEDLQADHLIELNQIMATGDLELAFDVDNLATRCGPCNRKRYHEGDKEFRQEWISPAYPEIMTAINKARSLEST